MKLLLDVGNTRVKWAYLADENQPEGALLEAGELTHRGRSPAEAVAQLARLPVMPTSVALVNVAGAELGSELLAVLQQAYGVQPQVFTTCARWRSVHCGYTDCAQLGADRWAAVVGAWMQVRGDVCVVDAGTAVTLDLVRANGQHLGGLIVPGLQLMESVLGGETADIADFSLGSAGPGEQNWYGRSTLEAVARGALFSLSATISQAVMEFSGPVLPRVLLTGGDARHLLAGLRSDVSAMAELQPQLVLRGLAYLASGT